MVKKKSSGRFEKIGKKIDSAFPKAEEEVQKVIKFLNDKVVPEVRTHSSKALRTAAEQLGKLAEYVDRQREEPGKAE